MSILSSAYHTRTHRHTHTVNIHTASLMHTSTKIIVSNCFQTGNVIFAKTSETPDGKIDTDQTVAATATPTALSEKYPTAQQL